MKVFTDSVLKVLFPVANHLGEGAFWDGAGQRLLWVDILARRVFVQSGGDNTAYVLPVMPSAIWKVVEDQAYLATEEGIGVLRLTDGEYRTLLEVEADRPETRSNDGGVAPDGSFWFGTMLREPKYKGGAIYRVSPDLAVARMEESVGIPNTFLFSSNGEQALIGDSFERRIYRYALGGGRLGKRQVWLAKDDADAGVPDGSVLLDDALVINAEWDGGRVVAYDMNGQECDALTLPVARPTSCALGGQNGRTLFVTSAREGLTSAELARQPDAGAVFAVELGEFTDGR